MKLTPIVDPTNNVTPSEKIIDRFFIEENDDNSVSFTLTDGTPIVMRELLTEDITKIEQFVLQQDGKSGSTAIAMKLISLLCTAWGDKKTVSYEELLKKPLRKFAPELKRFNKVFEFFRLEDLLSDDSE